MFMMFVYGYWGGGSETKKCIQSIIAWVIC